MTPTHKPFRPAAPVAGLLLLIAELVCVVPPAAVAAEKPKVRAVTAFARIERAHYREQVQEALVVLRRAKMAYEEAGYEVQSIRIATQPFPEYTSGLSTEEALAFFKEYDALAQKEDFAPAIGPALLDGSGDIRSVELLRQILLRTNLNASLTVAGEDGVRWKAVRAAAELIKHWSENSPGGIANFNFAATAMVPQHTPFFPGAYHTGEGKKFAVALQSANVVAESLASADDPQKARDVLAATLGAHAKAIEVVAERVAKETGWDYMGIDLSPAPLKDISIGGAVEGFTGAKFGSSGTMAVATLITGVLRELPVKHAGYSGLMVPVLEDSVLAERWSDGTLSLDALLAYSAVCGTGMDTVPLPGNVTVEQLERIIGDMASLAFKLRKPLSARLMPVKGKKAGDRTEFNDPFLVNAVLQPLP